MTPEEAFAELLARVGACSDESATISEEELDRWPSAAVAAMKSQGLLVKARAGTTVVCPGCEEQCVMPVNVVKDGAQYTRAFVVCDKRDDINRVAVSDRRMKQWRSDAKMLCAFVAASLGVRRSSQAATDARLMNVGFASGEKRSQMLALRPDGEPELVVASSTRPLSVLVAYRDGAYVLDASMIRQLVDAATTGDPRYTPNNVRREAGKLDTQAMREGWQRAYRALRKEHPDKPAFWCAQRIANSPAGCDRSPDTIRKQMKK